MKPKRIAPMISPIPRPTIASKQFLFFSWGDQACFDGTASIVSVISSTKTPEMVELQIAVQMLRGTSWSIRGEIRILHVSMMSWRIYEVVDCGLGGVVVLSFILEVRVKSGGF